MEFCRLILSSLEGLVQPDISELVKLLLLILLCILSFFVPFPLHFLQSPFDIDNISEQL